MLSERDVSFCHCSVAFAFLRALEVLFFPIFDLLISHVPIMAYLCKRSTFFEKLGDLLKIGPTGTNVNDLTFVIVT